ncbi:unnamed protein product [Linum trigynum]|uniref:S-protein homolog n=1 Tax=Linum trigynum TaxID=586398 RepID=A0AAV2GVW1_9ROSI
MAHPSVQALTVHVANKLSNKILIVHCRSKDDNLGAHAVEIGVEVRWSLELNFMATTLFWYYDLAVEDKRLSFEAYGTDMTYYDCFNVYDDGV